MSEIRLIPLSDVIRAPKVEASWSEHVKGDVGANAPIEPQFNREAAILASVKARQGK